MSEKKQETEREEKEQAEIKAEVEQKPKLESMEVKPEEKKEAKEKKFKSDSESKVGEKPSEEKKEAKEKKQESKSESTKPVERNPKAQKKAKERKAEISTAEAQKKTEDSRHAESSPQKIYNSEKTTHRPSQSARCDDKRCAIHGYLKIRGRVFEGVVVRDKMQKTIKVEWPFLFYIPKFERYEKRRSRVKAHNPPCISAKLGDRVKVAECRPIAKTVSFVVIEKLGEKK